MTEQDVINFIARNQLIIDDLAMETFPTLSNGQDFSALIKSRNSNPEKNDEKTFEMPARHDYPIMIEESQRVFIYRPGFFD